MRPLAGVPEYIAVPDISNYCPMRNGKVECLWVGDQIGRTVIGAWNAGGLGRVTNPVDGHDSTAKKIAPKVVRMKSGANGTVTLVMHVSAVAAIPPGSRSRKS